MYMKHWTHQGAELSLPFPYLHRQRKKQQLASYPGHFFSAKDLGKRLAMSLPASSFYLFGLSSPSVFYYPATFFYFMQQPNLKSICKGREYQMYSIPSVRCMWRVMWLPVKCTWSGQWPWNFGCTCMPTAQMFSWSYWRILPKDLFLPISRAVCKRIQAINRWQLGIGSHVWILTFT